MRGRGLLSSLAVPALLIASLAARSGIKRSPALRGRRIVILWGRERSTFSLRARSLDGVWTTAGPVPVRAQSDTPRSRRRGDLVEWAMLDLGESRLTWRDAGREKYDDRLPAHDDCDAARALSLTWRGGGEGRRRTRDISRQAGSAGAR